MEEKIYVGYRPVFTGIHHKFLVYRDASGDEWTVSGWAGHPAPPITRAPFDPVLRAQLPMALDFGPLRVRGGTSDPLRYDPASADYPVLVHGTEVAHPTEVAATGEDLSALWRAITDTADRIGAERHPYRPMTQNCNAMIDEILRRVGLPEPRDDGVGAHWSPGSGIPLGSDYSNLEPQATAQLLSLMAIPFQAALAPPDTGLLNVLLRLDGMMRDAEYCPLVLDLDGNGVSTLPMARWQPIHFDHDANGYAELTGWVAPGDGLLVRDLDGNGRIDSGRELFGQQSLLASGATALHGFQALEAFDLNGDHQVDAAEIQDAGIQVWRDVNSNGETDEGELLDAAQVGVHTLLLAHADRREVDASGNTHSQHGSYEDAAGTLHAMADVWFSVNPSRARALHPVDVSDEALALPQVPGMGNLPSLRHAMSGARGIELQGLLSAWIAADAAQRPALLESLIFLWAGVQDIHPASRLTYMDVAHPLQDSRRLEVLEEVLGREFHSLNPGWRGPLFARHEASVILMRAWRGLIQYVDGELALQTDYADAIAQIRVVRPVAPAPPAPGSLPINATGAGNEDASAGTAPQGQVAEAPPATAPGPLTADAFHLDVSALAAMVLTPPAGAPQDPVVQHARLAQLAPALLNRGPAGLAVLSALQAAALDGPEDALVILHGLKHGKPLIPHTQRVLAAPGSGSIKIGTAGNEVIEGSSSNDVISGMGGDDELAGNDGRDVYWFGLGHGRDTISDYSYSFYLEGVRSGDWLMIGRGLSPATCRATRVVNHLRLAWETGDQVTINHYFMAPGHQMPIGFHDGTRWLLPDVEARIDYEMTEDHDEVAGVLAHPNRMQLLGGHDLASGGWMADALFGGSGDDRLDTLSGDDRIDGGPGDDQCYAGVGHDLITGGTGNDRLDGNNGSDLYLFRRGDGHDTLMDSSHWSTVLDIDTLMLGEGLRPADTVVHREGYDLRMSWGDQDSVTVRYFFSPGALWSIEQFAFADGTVWSGTEITAQLGGTDDPLQASQTAAVWGLPVTSAEPLDLAHLLPAQVQALWLPTMNAYFAGLAV